MPPDGIHILMTGAGAPGAPGIINCLLQDASVTLTVADADAEATGRYLHNDFVQIAKAGDERFITVLINLCKEKKIRLILPLVTKELLILSKNKNLFQQNGIDVIVSGEKAITLANNKAACYSFLLSKDIRVPEFFIVNTVAEFMQAAVKLGHPENVFCFKPSFSNGSRGFRIVSDAINESVLLFNFKPNATFINYVHALKILSARAFPQLVVCEYLPGDEYSVDCLANNGKAVVVVPRLRNKMINGISVQGEFIKDERIIAYCTQIIKALNLHGNIGIQVKRSATGEPLLIEVNPRVQGTIVAGLGAGINLPLLAVKQELELPVAPEEYTVNWGTKFSRYWTEVFY